MQRKHALALALAVAWSSGEAHAYTLKSTSSGARVRWWQTSLELEVSVPPNARLSREEVVLAARTAAASWSAVPGAPAIEIRDAERQEWGRDGVNGIYVLDPWPFPDRRLAVTVSTYVEDSGQLVEADILINGEMNLALLADDRDGEPRYDLTLLVAHELGHALGLDESDVSDATMWPTVRPGEVRRRELAVDDVDAILDLYADDLGAPGCAIARGPRSASFALIVVAASLILAVRRRRR